MKVNRKEKFIKLLLAVMARTGLIVETFDFEKELLVMMEDRRYADLFYFFETMDDINFTELLNQYREEGLIDTTFTLREVTIRISNKMFYNVSDQILYQFDDNLIKLMEMLLRELDLSRSLQQEVSVPVMARYCLSNPNGMHTIKPVSSIVTDGDVRKAFAGSTGGIIVENATFLVIQDYIDKKLNDFQLFYKFEDKRFVLRLVREIIDFYRRIMNNTNRVEEDERFERLDNIEGYKYKKYV